jgi:beta-glucanase (GH16 family)
MSKVVKSADLTAWITANEYDEAVVVPPEPPVPEGDPIPLGVPAENYRLVFNENFNTLDSAIWNTNWLGAPGTITKPINSAELAAFDPAQVSIDNDQLKFTAIDKPVTATDGKRYQYRSGIVESATRKEFTFGIFESRIFMDGPPNAVPYNWGAFWLNGHHNEWPDRIESDVMENMSGGPMPHFHSVTQQNKGFGASPLVNKSGWHTYAEKWTTKKREYWYDGALCGSVTYTDKDYPQYIVLNLGISTEQGGPLRVRSFLLVVFCRVWQV